MNPKMKRNIAIVKSHPSAPKWACLDMPPLDTTDGPKFNKFFLTHEMITLVIKMPFLSRIQSL